MDKKVSQIIIRAFTSVGMSALSFLAASLLAVGTVSAAELDIPKGPLFLTVDVKPNILLAVDDSGSMDSEVLMPSNDGAMWFHTANESFTGIDKQGNDTTGVINFNVGGNANATWKKFTYLFPNGTGRTAGRRNYDDSTHAHYAIPPLPEYAYTRSPVYNAAYFNPSVEYTPWVRYDGSFFPDQGGASYDFTAVETDPTQGNETFNLEACRASNSAIALSGGAGCGVGAGNDDDDDDGGGGTNYCTSISAGATNNHLFKMYDGMTIPSGACYLDWTDNSWKVAGSAVALDQEREVGLLYFPATFWLPEGQAHQYIPDNFGYISNKRLTGGLAPDGTAMVGYELKLQNFTGQPHYDAAMRNFANWFTYYRKRHAATRAGIGESFVDLNRMRVGNLFINQLADDAANHDANDSNDTLAVTMRDMDDTAAGGAKQTFFDNIYNTTGDGGTPNRQALLATGRQFERDASPIIQYSCQQNFAILFTDGYATTWNGAGVGNTDAVADNTHTPPYSGVAPYSDAQNNTIADIAMNFYSSMNWAGINDINGNVLTGGKVLVPPGCNDDVPNPRLDCNKDPHMVTFGVTLGQAGEIFGENQAATDDPFTTNPDWNSINVNATRGPNMIDDLWHATINGRGQLLNAKTPRDIASQLQTVLNDIIGRTASASSVALNSGFLSANSQIYQARFNSSDWSGQLLALPVSDGTGNATCSASDPLGTVCPQQWDAAENVPAWDSRVITTYSHDHNHGHDFVWNKLSDAEKNLIHPGAGGNDATAIRTGELKLEYLRGRESFAAADQTITDNFRARTTLLGDMINSDPYFVGAPPFAYNFGDYFAYRQAKLNRTGVVYIGGNDGMLHGFRTTDGVELMAYVPSPVIKNLYKLTDPAYSHEFFVDASPTSGDVQVPGNDPSSTTWRTVLVGGLRSGGQGVYALDVSDPDSFSKDDVLWEFTDADDPDLGYTYSQPSIVRVKHGSTTKWAAVLGNGYNNAQNDGNVGDGESHLFILFMDGPGADNVWTEGTDYLKVSTGQGPLASPNDYSNGLSTPTVVDYGHLGAGSYGQDGIADFIYAGDLMGRMWRFEPGASQWEVSYSTSPLFTAVSRDADGGDPQPITAKPDVAVDRVTPNKPYNVLVYFGTGRYLYAGDNDPTTQTETQTFYAIRDSVNPADVPTLPYTRSDMTEQKILAEVQQDGTDCDETGNCFRVTADSTRLDDMGWYMDLVNQGETPLAHDGERQISNPIVRGKRVIFTTLIPSKDPCTFGGTGWLMEVDSATGQRLSHSPFDLNDDRQFNDDDEVTSDHTGSNDDYASSGSRSNVGIIPRPTILGVAGEDYEIKFTAGSTGQIESTVESTSGRFGRLSWRELRQ